MEDMGFGWRQKDLAVGLLGGVVLPLRSLLVALMLGRLGRNAVLRGRIIGLIGIHVQTSFPGMQG